MAGSGITSTTAATVVALGGFVGDLTGNVTGNITGDVAGAVAATTLSASGAVTYASTVKFTGLGTANPAAIGMLYYDTNGFVRIRLT